MSIGKNIRRIREEHDLTQEEFGAIAGVSSMAVSQWENDRAVPRMGAVQRLADYFGVKKGEIVDEGSDSPDAAFVDVPLYGSIAAGMPIEMDAADDMHPIPSSVHRMWPDAFLLRVEGRSMDRILPDGCYALVDPRRDVVHDGMPHAVCVNGYDATVKRVRRLANGFELAPDSMDPTYKPKIYDYGEAGTEEITIIGEVVWYCVPDDWSF